MRPRAFARSPQPDQPGSSVGTGLRVLSKMTELRKLTTSRRSLRRSIRNSRLAADIALDTLMGVTSTAPAAGMAAR
ncbi:hypothetical protein BN6_06910 [Saccharothrix espanaensis DSM 44229]|uniref:Uncharacterized protein n=1 Tax=Saccharothrix espanaensis (strain ATCC 51144 / DSM 44229 / JCM 9112 / NBRC 15066 / NRRL 15764) TaxID=1179773 RepID=K0JT65_SACES|nr:hypothetical protein BN6_06910 [Saccharothrix espanaensis DSM 44229]